MSEIITPLSAVLRAAAFDSAPMPQVVLDGSGRIVAVNASSRRHFGMTQEDAGRPFSELELSYRPAELRSGLDRMAQDLHGIRIPGIQWSVGGEPRVFDVHLTPALDAERRLVGSCITFVDITAASTAEAALLHCRQEVETAYEELQSTNEELETTNEELQSTVEELETTNEELQSTNEELETMNEELHSTNEELQTINDELRTRSSETSCPPCVPSSKTRRSRKR